MSIFHRCLFASLLTALPALPVALAGEAASSIDKVHPRVATEALSSGVAEFLVVFEEQADVRPATGLATKSQRGKWVHETLREVSRRTQAPLLGWLEQRGVEHRSYWIVNMVWGRADFETIAKIAARADVRRIDANPSVAFHEPIDARADEGDDDGESVSSLEWGITKTGADQLWALGFDGTGVVIGGQDTGYEWDHPALKAHYRGWDGSSADHDYNWHDSIHGGGGGSCGVDSPEPCDDFGHGTHTMGTMVGDDGGSNQIGMAPGAQWIGCRNMNQGDGTPASYAECFQFFLAPTDVAGNFPDTEKAPHVINNSWICIASEGCSWDTLQSIVENTRAAGIVVVASAGNDGSACSTIDSPPAIYDAAFTVGATDSSDQIAQFSSRGPVTVDGSDRLKPDVTAPGVSVRSSVPGGGYSFFSGTSMAGPHTAGLVALLLDARPDLIGNVETVEQILRLSAFPLTSGTTCGGMPGSSVPNPIYGHGRIDAVAAVLDDSDGDGVDNLSDCAPTNGQVSGPPGPAGELRLEENNLATALFWDAPVDASATVRYDVLRAAQADDFATPVCLVSDNPNTAAFDVELPGSLFYYLIRTENECGGNLGADSVGTPRAAGSCPDSP